MNRNLMPNDLGATGSQYLPPWWLNGVLESESRSVQWVRINGDRVINDEEVGAGRKVQPLWTLPLPYDGESGTCLCMVILWMKMGWWLPSVLSPLLQMLNYKHIRKLWSCPSLLGSSLSSLRTQSQAIWMSEVSSNSAFWSKRNSFFYTENCPTGETSHGKGEALNTVLLKINFHVFEASYVYSDCFLFRT